MGDPSSNVLLRTDASFEMIPFDWLTEAERRHVRSANLERDAYGIVRKRASDAGSGIAVSADVALLILTLRTPGPVPAYVRAALGAAYSQTLATLVGDGVLEVAAGGTFLSGPRGLAAICGDGDERAGAWATDQRSAAALRYALAADTSDARAIAARLYAYHRLPASARWRRLLSSPAAVERFLGIGTAGGNRNAIAFRSAGGWYQWQATTDAAACRFKLYVSPQLEALPETFARVIAHARKTATAMKVGADLHGLLRPDRFVVYFPTFEALADTLAGLRSVVQGTPVHGVPFTAEAGSETPMSWGVDGYRSEQTPLEAPASWRRWVTMRVAEALVSAKAQHGNDDRAIWQYVNRRLALAGVDARTWTPSTARASSARTS